MYAGKRKALVTNTNPDIVVKAHLYCWHWGMRMIAIILTFCLKHAQGTSLLGTILQPLDKGQKPCPSQSPPKGR